MLLPNLEKVYFLINFRRLLFYFYQNVNCLKFHIHKKTIQKTMTLNKEYFIVLIG